MAKVNIVHIPFKGGTESLIATVAGEIDISFAGAAAAVPLLNAGRLRALGITSSRRVPSLPSVPTLSEAGLPGYDRATWFGLVAPAGVPRNLIARLNAAIANAVNSADVKTVLSSQGFDPRTTTPEQFAAMIQSEIAQKMKLIKISGVKTE